MDWNGKRLWYIETDQIQGEARLDHPILGGETNFAYLDVWDKVCDFLSNQEIYRLMMAFPVLLQSNRKYNDTCYNYELDTPFVCSSCFIRFTCAGELDLHKEEKHKYLLMIKKGERRLRVVDYYSEFILFKEVDEVFTSEFMNQWMRAMNKEFRPKCLLYKCSFCVGYHAKFEDFIVHMIDSHYELYCETC